MKDVKFYEKLFLVLVLGLMFVALAQSSTTIDPDYIDVPELRIDGVPFTEGDYTSWSFYGIINTTGKAYSQDLAWMTNDGYIYLFDSGGGTDMNVLHINGTEIATNIQVYDSDAYIRLGYVSTTSITNRYWYKCKNASSSTSFEIYDRGTLLQSINVTSDVAYIDDTQWWEQDSCISPNGKYIVIIAEDSPGNEYMLIYEGS